MIDKIADYLAEMKIPFEINGNYIDFTHKGITFWADAKGKVGVNKSFHGKIPHVMLDGALCVSGNTAMNFWDNEIVLFWKTIDVYTPWLMGLQPNYCVAEMISELEYYVVSKLDSKFKYVSDKDVPSQFTNKCILNPSDLWTQLSMLDENIWYKIFPFELENHYAYVTLINGIYYINFDQYAKAKMRVSGMNFSSYNQKTAFIGVGSVNSYIIKTLASKGLTEYILIDFDTVKIDNMFRFAFPFKDISKIDSAHLFLKWVCHEETLVVEKHNVKIDKESENYVKDVLSIYVSVDNYLSWFRIGDYLDKYVAEGTIINFVGVDTFGRFGKHLSFSFDKSIKENVFINLIKFLDFDPNIGEERKQMIGNGCGKSIAIYGEIELLKLADSVFNSDEGKVHYVTF